MKNRLATAGIAAPVVLTLALGLSACASSGPTIAGQGAAGPAGSSAPTGSQNVGGSSSSASSPSTGSSSSSSPALSLAARLGQGITQVKTAHLTLDLAVAGQSITAHGDEQLSSGKLVALDLTESVTSAFSLRLIIVNGKTYARLPSSVSHTNKPWVLATANSKNPAIKAFGSILSSTQSSASLSAITALVSAARSVKQSGSSNTYKVDVDPAKLPKSYVGRKALAASGLTSIPLTITLDSAGRPVVVTENLTVSGQKLTTKITLGSYNKPVHITAPPASQVSTS